MKLVDRPNLQGATSKLMYLIIEIYFRYPKFNFSMQITNYIKLQKLILRLFVETGLRCFIFELFKETHFLYLIFDFSLETLNTVFMKAFLQAS